ncbi:MAG TPA: PAS domain S-box protein [Thermodesulfobacteriota bacterium]|nr:PAS domain S-box protein [Thermodesulfobacteriota bacterium]
MKNLFPSSIRSKLILLGVLAFLPVLLLTVFNSWHHRRLEIADARVRMGKILDFAVLHEEEVIRETHRILAMLADVPILLEGGKPAGEYLARFLKHSPEYANFGLIRPDGQVIASALPFKKSLNLSDRPYFQDAIKARTLSVGRYQVGRITGTPVINFGYPVIDRQGKLTAVIFAALDLSRVTKFGSEINVQTPENSSYVKLDSHGSVLSAYPPAQVFGRGDPLEKSFLRKILKEKKGMFEASGSDGVERLYQFSSYRSPLDKEGGYALLGIPTKALFSEVDRLFVMVLVVLSVSAVLFLAIIWFGGNTLIVRPIGLLVDASKRLAAGDLTSRSGFVSAQGEFGQLGRTFNEMAEEIQRRQEESTRLVMAVEQSADGIILTDREGAILYVNPAFERITGYSREEAVGKNPRILNSGKQDESFYREMWKALARGEVWTGHFINRKKDGTFYEEDATISPVRDSSGKVFGFVAVKRDVTRLLSLEKQVRMAQKMEAVGTLAGGIAHDFNNVLTVIIGFGEMLKRRIAGDPQAVSDLDQVLRSAERASVLTRQLLTFARRQIIDLGKLDRNQVVTDFELFLRKAMREDIEIKMLPTETPVTIRADRGQIEQILMNLSINGRDAMPAGGRLIIETEVISLEEGYLNQYPYMKAGRYAVLSVSDTGAGMDEKTRERVFEPFFTTKGPDKGTGLGLAVVYGIVKQHNGFIHLYSEPGKGSTFRVYFPAVDAPPDPRISAVHPVSLGGNETILLAEDEESVRNLMEQTLKSYGYRVLIARDGEEAVDLFHRRGKEIAIVLLDLVMPKMGGKRAYDEMILTAPGLKVLFLSGYSANAIHESFVLLPGFQFLQKPFGPDALARKVREVLDNV